MIPLLAVQQLRKRFGARLILDGLDLTLLAGQCTVLTGPNGAGKTSLLKILAGLLPPDNARVTLDGVTRSWRRSRRQLQKRIVYLHQQPYLFDNTVSGNLAYALGMGAERTQCDRIREALQWAGLAHLAEARAETLSGGERQRIALARAWLRRPGILLLDEPMTSMDQSSRQRTQDMLGELHRDGVCLVISSHTPGELGSLVSAHWHLEQGVLESRPVLRGVTNLLSSPRQARLSGSG
jgi:tungstate transport system ATP-binding protein